MSPVSTGRLARTPHGLRLCPLLGRRDGSGTRGWNGDWGTAIRTAHGLASQRIGRSKTVAAVPAIDGDRHPVISLGDSCPRVHQIPLKQAISQDLS